MERSVRELPRLSPNGYYLADVGAHAVRNDEDAALDALEAAEREGWRGPGWRYARDRAPALSTIRGLPRFDAVFQRIERDMDVQRRRLEARAPERATADSPALIAAGAGFGPQRTLRRCGPSSGLAHFLFLWTGWK